MSPSLNPLAQAIASVLVTALVTVEHDREKHVPGVTSGPNAENFLVPDHVADSLIKAGAVKRAEVVDADALASVVDTSLLGTNTATGLVTTFADAAEMAEADKLRAQLADAVAARDNLIEQLADTQEQLADVSARLVAADAQLTLTPTNTGTGTETVGTLVADTAAAASTAPNVAAADAAAAAAGTADALAADAAAQTADQAVVDQAAADAAAADAAASSSAVTTTATKTRKTA